ncbi:MAG: ATP-binding protein [Gallionella sp.]
MSVSASLMYGVYYDLKDDAQQNADRMSRILAYSLKPLLLNDDVWRAYETINSPMQSSSGKKENYIDEILILNPRQQIYVSTHPRQFPVRSELSLLNPKLDKLSSEISRSLIDTPKSVELAESGKSYMVTPIISDGVLLGTLVIGYSSSMFLPHFYDIVWRSIITTLIVGAVLLPLSWFWGWRMSIPLTQLSESMSKVGWGTPLPDPDEFDLYESRDEIGQMGSAFKRMLRDLKHKENLEKQVLVSERLAAVGRLTAGIAHEINNPLGGMLITINTAKKHGSSDPQIQKTISLLERGLLQIKDIIGALLVEAKFQNHPLTVQDIEDTRTLVLANVRNKSIELNWGNDVQETLPLPSTLVRQVLINLLLNAIQASDAHVDCHIYRDSGNLSLVIKNDGKHIDPEQMSYLFEPFSSGREEGYGLGLWMTYQIVSQLNGLITMQSQPGETIFSVTLPLGVPS